MSDTTFDPRERVMRLGNEILDLIFVMQTAEVSPADLKTMLDSTDDAMKDRATELLKDGKTLLSMLTTTFEYEAKLKEWVTLRRTIESLDAVRTDEALS